MQLKPIMVVALASLVLVPYAFADSGKGKSGSGGGATQGSANGGVRLIAKMTPAPGSIQDSLFEGHAVRRTQGTARTEFEARVEVPLNLINGEPADLNPTLQLTGAGLILCTMVLDQVDDVTEVAQYKTSIRSRNGNVVNRAGSCGLPGVPTIPDVQIGNSASVAIGNNVLQGTFVTK